MNKQLPIVALIYDFDGTLAPGNMQEYDFLNAIGVTEPKKFWEANKAFKKYHDASEVLSYMKLMLDESKKHNIPIKRDVFKKYGATIPLHPGVIDWFMVINKLGEKMGYQIKHYINSSGLQEIIEGTAIYPNFEAVYACRYMYDDRNEAIWPAVAVDFTQKTQFMYMINKGVKSVSDNGEINRHQDDTERQVPFQRMIYFGDGATDIPCMKLLKQYGGYSVAIYQDSKERSKVPGSEHTICNLIDRGICDFACEADYSENGPVYNTVLALLEKIGSQEKHLMIQSQNLQDIEKRKADWDKVPERQRMVQFLYTPMMEGVELTIDCPKCHKEVKLSIFDLPDVYDLGSVYTFFKTNRKQVVVNCPQCSEPIIANIDINQYIGRVSLTNISNGEVIPIKSYRELTFIDVLAESFKK